MVEKREKSLERIDRRKIQKQVSNRLSKHKAIEPIQKKSSKMRVTSSKSKANSILVNNLNKDKYLKPTAAAAPNKVHKKNKSSQLSENIQTSENNDQLLSLD